MIPHTLRVPGIPEATASLLALALLTPPNGQDQLRFLTCGSVDDGKSTLIGRLLHDAGLLYDDQLVALHKDSQRHYKEHLHGEPDYSLLMDGLLAEREQGITIDVAYRHFATARRRFIVADAPGHEQYTPNMVTAASTSDLAVVLLDATVGLLPQTRRHTRIVTLLGIRTIVLAVNKMDLVNYDQSRFDQIRLEYQEMAAACGAVDVMCIPVSALKGENVVRRATKNMPWYEGPTLLPWLEYIRPAPSGIELPFRMPIQWANVPDTHFRGASGQVVAGHIRPGDPVCVAGTSVSTRVERIVAFDGDLTEAHEGDAVTLTFNDPIDAGRGLVLAARDAPPETTDHFSADVIWMGQTPLRPGRQYLLRRGPCTLLATVTSINWRFNITTQARDEADSLAFNEAGRCDFALSTPLPVELYAHNRALGGFILVDHISNATVGAGLIRATQGRMDNLSWQHFDVNKEQRAMAKGQAPCVMWFTGLSASGKSTVADLVERRLFALGRHTYVLDGDNIRHGLSRDLGFSDADRAENIRRVAQVARLMVDAGLIVLVTFISPFRNERRLARELLCPGEFFECYIDTPLTVCEERDPKGLYRKARSGKLTQFTGLNSPYEPPENPDLLLHGASNNAEELADQVLEFMKKMRLV